VTVDETAAHQIEPQTQKLKELNLQLTIRIYYGDIYFTYYLTGLHLQIG